MARATHGGTIGVTIGVTDVDHGCTTAFGLAMVDSHGYNFRSHWWQPRLTAMPKGSYGCQGGQS